MNSGVFAWRKSMLVSLLVAVIAAFVYTFWKRQTPSSEGNPHDHRNQTVKGYAMPPPYHTRSASDKVDDEKSNANSNAPLPFAAPMTKEQKTRVQQRLETFRKVLANNEFARTTIVFNKPLEEGHLTVFGIAKATEEDLNAIRNEAQTATEGLDALEQRNFTREAESLALDYTQFKAEYRILALGVPNEGSLEEILYVVMDANSLADVTLTEEGSLRIPGTDPAPLMPFKRWYTDDMQPSIRYRHLARIVESE